MYIYIHKVTGGPYAIIAKIGAKDRNEIKERTEDIKNLDYIDLTASLIVL